MGYLKLVYGVGINDVLGGSKGPNKPYYSRWRKMLERCYSEKRKLTLPTYEGCTVCDEWIYFSKFKAWMETQDWEGKELDKDLLVKDNKVYGPNTCIFVDAKVNMFFRDFSRNTNGLPTGVYFETERGKFVATTQCVFTGKHKFTGRFNTPKEANRAWLEFKIEQAYILAEQQADVRVVLALISRYKIKED